MISGMKKVTVFWHEHYRPEYQKWLSKEFKSGRLRQGWGPRGSSLLGKNGSPVPLEQWRIGYFKGIKDWNCSEEKRQDYRAKSDRRFEILSTMTEPKPGDLIVAPLMPDTKHDSIVQLQGGYQFRPAKGKDDFGHVLRIDPKSMVKFAHRSSSDANKLRKVCRHYRSALNRVKKPENIELINRLYGNSGSGKIGSFEDSDMPDVDAAPPGRISTTIQRTVRQTEKSRGLKKLYQYKCQLCSQRLESPSPSGSDQAYAEVHHLRPLAVEHAGFDNWDNMLVLCPNFHVLFDLLALAIDPKTQQVITFKTMGAHSFERIHFHPKHQLVRENVAYHWKRFKKLMN